jgi:hypothetical protein
MDVPKNIRPKGASFVFEFYLEVKVWWEQDPNSGAELVVTAERGLVHICRRKEWHILSTYLL